MSEPLSEKALRRLLAMAADDDAEPAAVDLAALPERYEIRRELGRGGMGVVYEAFDRQLQRRVALKVLTARSLDPTGRRRLQREAMAAARLRHPNIAAVFDATDAYIAMQCIDGAPIDQDPPRDRRTTVALLRDAARAVHHAHEQGIVHRDLKPSNLLVENGTLFVVDFGLAKELAQDHSQSLPGTVVGTPAFMAPEQAQGRSDAVDARSDVWSLGATLHHCLSGAPPFEGQDLPALLQQVVEGEPRPPRQGRELDLVLLQCLRKDKSDRYASAAALADDLQRWLDGVPVHAAPPSLWRRCHTLIARRRSALRAAAWAAAGAVLLTALVLGPLWWQQRTARLAADGAVALADRAGAALRDAAVYTRLGDQDSALQVLDDCNRRVVAFLAEHDVPRVHQLHCRLLLARGDADGALAAIECAIAGDPTLTEARFQRGLLLVSLPDPTTAQCDEARNDLDIPPTEPGALTSLDLLFGRAESRRLHGDIVSAQAMLEELLVHDPTNVPARRALSRCALAMGNADLARHYAVSALDVLQGFGPTYLARENARWSIAILDLDAALVDFGAELSADDNAPALAQRSLAQLRRAARLRNSGDAARALGAALAATDDLDVILALHPQILGARVNRAVCAQLADELHAALGDTDAAATARRSARSELEAVLAEAPRLREAACNLGLLSLRTAALLRALGRREAAAQQRTAARALLHRALDAAPANWPFAAVCRRALAALDADR